MAIEKTFNGASIIEAGVYSKIVVENLTGFPPSATGIVGIIGESKGGKPRVLDILTRDQIQSAKDRYKEGNIADALELLVSPSGDPRVANGASTIIVYKTNNSTQGTLALANNAAAPATVMTATSVNYGTDENNTNISVADGTVTDLNALIEGTVVETFDFSGGSDTLILNINDTVYTYTSVLSGAAETAAAVQADLDTGARWSPSKPINATLFETTKIKIEIDTSALAAAALDLGYIQVDATSTADTILGITGSNRGRKGGRIFTIKSGTTEEISTEQGGIDQMSIQYTGAGTDAELSIQVTASELKLTTTITGQSHNLDIVLEDASGNNQHTLRLGSLFRDIRISF